ncbi:MAG: putative selenium-dependent hydroxylase accessory protein YqeC, partial [Proteobacteria bacterium]|nr:putative selenium-dependent hydroxylase accessory protein YqeC [Pseudomonadota bacterium]
GGGKTTALYRLVREWRALGLSAAAATTTKIAVPGPGEPELSTGQRWDEVRRAVSVHRGSDLVLGRRMLPGGKVEGIPPEWCDLLLAEGLLDALAVEADGAARLPIKAPAPWEPVVPRTTSTFVAVVGLSCVGTPLDDEHAFRPECVAAATGLRIGDRIEADAVTRLLRSPSGLARGLPRGGRAAVLLNQADGPAQMAAGRAIADGLLGGERTYERVVVAALKGERALCEVWVP